MSLIERGMDWQLFGYWIRAKEMEDSCKDKPGICQQAIVSYPQGYDKSCGGVVLALLEGNAGVILRRRRRG